MLEQDICDAIDRPNPYKLKNIRMKSSPVLILLKLNLNR